MLHSRSGESLGCWALALLVCGWAAGADGRSEHRRRFVPALYLGRAPAMPAVYWSSSQKVNWKSWPERMSTPPGKRRAKRRSESIAPPQGSVPSRHLSCCFWSTPVAWAKPVQVRPLASSNRFRLGSPDGSRRPDKRSEPDVAQLTLDGEERVRDLLVIKGQGPGLAEAVLPRDGDGRNLAVQGSE